MTVKDYIFKLPENVNPAAVEGMETVFQFDFGDEQYTLDLKDGKLTASEGLNGEPSCTVSGKPDAFMQVINGSLNPMVAMVTGKLKVSNLGEMMKYAKMFGIL